jgi:hypothetical protein
VSKNVFANGKEISAKKDGNESICAMPDVCNSPPTPPAGPVPIPYPNTASASDTTDGSKTVKIGGDEVGLKNASTYKKSSGDEAATKTLGMNLTTHTIQGKMQHAAWSMDVKIEGANAIRHMDMTTHNHMNTAGTASMTLDRAKEKAAANQDLNCEELDALNQDARSNELDQSKLSTTNKRTKQTEPVGYALTTASRTNANGATYALKATSLDKKTCIKPECKSGYEDPIDKNNTNDRPPCGGGGKYDFQHKNDSETKILDPEMRPPMVGGGSIRMKVFHQGVTKRRKVTKLADGVFKRQTTTTVKRDEMPCGTCKKTICQAEACGINVVLCNNKNEEVNAKDLCENGSPKPAKGTSAQRTKLWASKGFGSTPS